MPSKRNATLTLDGVVVSTGSYDEIFPRRELVQLPPNFNVHSVVVIKLQPTHTQSNGFLVLLALSPHLFMHFLVM